MFDGLKKFAKSFTKTEPEMAPIPPPRLEPAAEAISEARVRVVEKANAPSVVELGRVAGIDDLARDFARDRIDPQALAAIAKTPEEIDKFRGHVRAYKVRDGLEALANNRGALEIAEQAAIAEDEAAERAVKKAIAHRGRTARARELARLRARAAVEAVTALENLEAHLAAFRQTGKWIDGRLVSEGPLRWESQKARDAFLAKPKLSWHEAVAGGLVGSSAPRAGA